jgi:hypothetical protein
MGTVRLPWLVVAAGGALFACTDVESPTDLNPEGPPMVRQIFINERIPIGSGTACQTDSECTAVGEECIDNACLSPFLFQNSDALAYGTHPQAVVGSKRRVTRAGALPNNQQMRVVIDELLVGNYLEKIACRGPVDDEGAYSFVPLGTTPDDVAACAVPADVLAESCTGDNAVCVDMRNAPPCVDGACGPGLTCTQGVCAIPVGVLDLEPEELGGDGAADDTQLIAGSVGIRCQDGSSTIDVPMNLQESYWYPSGNQQVPAVGGIRALGPAIVLEPLDGLPTGKTCTVVFSSSVVDKGGNQVCAPVWGPSGAPDETTWPPAVPCTPGDTSDTVFTVEPLALTSYSGPIEGEVGYPPGQNIIIEFNAKMDEASFADATFTPAPPMAPVISRGGNQQQQITISIPGGLAPNTAYTFSAPSAADVFGGELSEPFQVTFTTGT